MRQGLRALLPVPPVAMPRRLEAQLPDAVLTMWGALARFDRRHLVAVAHELEATGQPHHVVLAGLLHDIGKAGRITIFDRVALVLLNRLAPGVSRRLAARSRPRPGLNGLHLLVCHADRGANMLARAGMPAEVVWLVRHHERDIADPGLLALRAADHRH